MSTFIVSTSPAKIVGYVQNAEIAKEKAGDNLVVNSKEDLSSLSSEQLIRLYSSITLSETQTPVSAGYVFDAMKNTDIASLVQLDKSETAAVEKSATTLVDAKGRKVRDSKLQRMAAAFRQQDENGAYRIWTIKELMEKCSKEKDPLSERIAHVYISILRAQNDRFVMNIVKNKDTGTFQYQPKPQRTR